ncbi:pyocin knob domain-containing protein [Lactobacillus amylovorus]|uniref:pyocin knob domain-containing protein n=1 Tax=Lactobacillus amylovorus TaxID=1604 RepID=UPI0023312256|nr:pyocin knob domain-containing protein [Lactobacillus amylovorus]MDB6267230.1 pyocin knob domain-containing protein [Lactobacillus amylovorus]
MSQYNKTVLTNAGLELAKRANAGQAKFEITRAVTSADDWSNKTVQDIEAVTAIPNIMQQGTIIDTEEVESNNSVMGVSLCFTNKGLSAGYQIKIMGVYAKEEGQDKDFLYAVTTAVAPEYMPDFNDEVLYRFNMQMYLVIGKAQAVNVVINDGASVTHRQFDNYKNEVTANLKKIENAHKEDMSHVVKSASINGGSEVLPDEAGKLELVVPDPDLSKYVSLEQLTETLKTKADITAVPDKNATEEGIKQAKEIAQEADTKAQSALDNKADKTTVEENLATKANVSDLSALQNSAMQVIDGNSGDDILSFRDEKIRCYNNAQNVQNLPDMSNKTWFYVITHTKKGWGSVTVISQDNCYWQNVLNGNNWSGWVKYATNVDITNLQSKINSKTSGTIVTAYDIANKNPTKETNSYTNKWLVDQNVLGQFADQINQLKGRRTVDAQDFNNLTDTGTYYVSNPGANKPTGSWGNLFVSNGDGHRTSQLYFPDDNSAPWYRTLDEGTWHDWTQLASASQVTNAQNTANSANTNANGRLSLGGGNMTLRSTINWNGGNIDDRTGNLGGLNWSGGTDWAKIYGDQDGNNNLDLAIDLGDDGSNHVSFRKNGSETSAITSDGHFTGTVDWGHVNGRPQDQVDRVNTITPLFRQIQNSNNWNDIFGVDNPNNVLTSIRIDAGGSGALLNDFAAGIGFGGADTKGVLSVAYSDHQARITGGNGTGPVWSEDIAWKSDVNDLRNQVQQLRDNQFEVQTFTDATAAANWEAQRPGKRMAIVNS